MPNNNWTPAPAATYCASLLIQSTRGQKTHALARLPTIEPPVTTHVLFQYLSNNLPVVAHCNVRFQAKDPVSRFKARLLSVL